MNLRDFVLLVEKALAKVPLKTYFSAFALAVLAIYEFSIGDYIAAYQTLAAVLALVGLRNGIAKLDPRV